MKVLGIIVNIFLPGVGTLFVKKWGQAITQIILAIIGGALSATGILSIVGLPLLIGVWIWSIVTVVNTPSQPVEVVVNQK